MLRAPRTLAVTFSRARERLSKPSASFLSTKSRGDTKPTSSGEPPSKIPKGTFTVKWILSGGPGGQNVNKVNTKAELRMNTNAGSKNIRWLPESVRQRLVSGKAKNRINTSGDLVIHNMETRKAKTNAERAEVRCGASRLVGRFQVTDSLPPPQRVLLSLIEEAWPEPKERNQYAGPSKAEKKRRVEFKRRRKEVKSLRRKGGRGGDDY